MKKAQKEQAEQLVGLLGRVHDGVRMSIEAGQKDSAMDLLGQCQEGAISLGEMIEESEGEGFVTVRLLEEYCETVYQFYEKLQQGQSINGSKVHKSLRKSLIQVKNSVKNDIRVRTEAVFLPYKASMWDSLESVWKAADEDPDCDAYVIPIPYYDRNPDGSFREEHYEGDQYPKYVPITWYGDYDFAERQPDFIFIHNPYDECNYVTSVHPFFYARNLKQYTNKLVYISYFILNEIDPENTEAVKSMEHFCTTPGVIYADRVIVQSEDMRKVYVNVMTEFAKEAGMTGMDRKYWEDKILGLGSPKVDKVLNTRREELEIPKEWLKIIVKPDGSWKKVIFYNTSVTTLLQHGEQYLKKMQDVFRIFYESREDVALLWRPHPLIKATIESMRPKLAKEYDKIAVTYQKERWGIYDDTADIDRAVAICDVYYGDESSVVKLCREAGKSVMVQDVAVLSGVEDILLSTYNMAKIEEDIFFASKNVPGLFVYNKKTDLIEQIATGVLEENNICSRFAFGGICICKKGILFAPFASSKILIYSSTKKEVEIIDLNKLLNLKIEKKFYIKRAIAYKNTIYFICNKNCEMLCLNIDTMQTTILDSWKKKLLMNENVTDFIGVNTGGDICIVEDSIWVPVNYNNYILEINMRTQEEILHKINIQEMIFSTICFDGLCFWLTGYENVIVKWNRLNNYTEIFDVFPEGFCKFYKEGYWEELFTRSFYENGYVYLFPMTVNMALKVEINTGQIQKMYQWDELESCYTVEKWEENIFYIETGNDNYIDINHSMLMDTNGYVLKHNIFEILAKNMKYIFKENKYKNCMETLSFALERMLLEY